MFRRPTFRDFLSLFLKPTVGRALAGIERTLADLQDAEAHALAEAREQRRFQAELEFSALLAGVQAAEQEAEAQRAAKAAAKIGELIA